MNKFIDLRKDWWKVLLGGWMSAVIVAAFLYAPRGKGLGESVRILFFHVPCAWIASIAFIISMVYSIRYLRKPDFSHDAYAYAAAQLGFVFTILATVTGAVWANEIWGHPWNWDPRQTSIFILLLVYGAYFALRSALEGEHERARLAAVYCIIATVAMPFFMFIVPRVFESLHPDPLINAEGKVKMGAKMQSVFYSSLLGFGVLFYWLLRQRWEILMLKRNLVLKRLED